MAFGMGTHYLICAVNHWEIVWIVDGMKKIKFLMDTYKEIDEHIGRKAIL